MISTDVLTRRQLLQFSGAAVLASPLAWLPTGLAAQPGDSAKSPSPLKPLNHFPRMVQEYFVDRVREIRGRANAEFDSLKTKGDAEDYIARVRQKIADCFGPLPEKTPLNPRVTRVLKRDGYQVENVLFESRPDFMVTANLYLPTDRPGPFPGVVGSCGHSGVGKADSQYQSFAQGLARLGYACLLFDPIGQGERLQYKHVQPSVSAGVSEHVLCGNQQFLVGEYFGTWRAWDGIRALDYLLSRPEVDPRHVGVTGNSGGGTMTTWLCGLDRRWTMAAPNCFVTTFLHNLENELPADTEQCPPGVLAHGLDHSDFLAAMAPAPVILLAEEKDFFDPRGTVTAFNRLKRLYALLGAEENVQLYIGPEGHGYWRGGREAMYQWFNRATQVSQATQEPELVLEKPEDLYCSPSGQVADMGSRSVFSFTRQKSRELAAQRGELSPAALATTLVDVLKIPEWKGVPYYRILRANSGRRHPGKYTNTYAVETEPGIQALVYWVTDDPTRGSPTRTKAPAILYISHHSSDVELREEKLIAEVTAAAPGAVLYTCDVRGIGESQPDTCGSDAFLKPYGSDFFYATHSIMLGQPYAGQKTYDILRVIDWLKSFDHESVHLVALGWGTIPATFAAVLSPDVTAVTLKRGLNSYRSLAESERYQWPLSTFVNGVLTRFDLPDCYRVLESKSLRQIEPQGASIAVID
ncbi:alpha/beta hydrolase family protein [Planctomicrobium sp. SH664]|uniref:alpha/beta hydrolase family protein n=1 Tax=Planctomicrobium sp. SH664 TaxID=3448125 RepID=UPI003F5C7494